MAVLILWSLMTQHSPLWNPDLYNQALSFAAHHHAGQLVPGSQKPYLVHLCQVCQEALQAVSQANDPSCDGNLVMLCAILHDSIEDTNATYAEVKDLFGEAVADGVQALSKDPVIGKGLPKPERKRLQMKDSLRRILTQPSEVHMVKLADRITNLQTPPARWTVEKRRNYREEAQLIMEALGSSSLLLKQRIEAKIEAYQQYCV